MQISLNLLPPEQKERLGQRFRFRFFTWQTILLLFLELFYVAILGGTLYLLDRQVKSAESAEATFGQQNNEAHKLNEYQAVFATANALSFKVAGVTKKHLQWTNMLELLDKLTNDGIVFVALSTQDYTVTLNGQARTRDDFLAFQDHLRQSDCVSDVKVPISNIFSEKEIDFQVSFNVKRECLLATKE